MKRLLGLLVMFTVGWQLYAQTMEVDGNVKGTWQVDTVKVTGDIFVAAGETLAIASGVHVEFAGHYKMVVMGTLQATGKEKDSIVFTINNKDNFDDFTVPDGGWHGIHFEGKYISNEQDSSILDYCVFRYAKGVGNDSLDRYRGAVYADDYDKLRISHSTFSDNYAQKQGAAIGLYRSDAIIKDCVIKDNLTNTNGSDPGSGAGLSAMESEFLLERCLFSGNRSNSVGGTMFISSCDEVQISHCTFTGSGGSTGGVIFLLNSYDVLFSNNLLYGNESLYFGGAMAGKQSEAKFINCTITENRSGQGGAIYMSNDAVFEFYNCIVYGNHAGANGQDVYIAYNSSTCSFLYCNVKGGVEAFGGGGNGDAYWGKFDDNIDAAPCFINAGEQDYRIADNSPCRNAGTLNFIERYIPEYDLGGKKRIVNEMIDIGAFENQTDIETSIPFAQKEALRWSYVNNVLRFESTTEVKRFYVYDLNGMLLHASSPQARFGVYSLQLSGAPVVIIRTVLTDNTTVTKKLFIQ